MEKTIKTFAFKPSPIEIEVKDLKFVRELPKLLGNPHKTAFFQVVWLVRGDAVFRIDFREIPVEAGDVLIISAGQVVQFDTVSDYAGKMILFTPSFFTITELDSDFLYTSDVLNPVSLNTTIRVSDGTMNSLMTLLDEELGRSGDDYQTGIAQSLLRVILLEAERKHRASHPAVVNSLARRFYNAVEQHFRRNRHAGYYVKLLGANEKNLSRQIKALAGKTPKVYIDSRIVLEAKRLLAYSNLTAKEIGFELGFDEPTNFAKYFRKHTRMTPAEFRCLARK
ncbi:helix-turn-helix domain-containing protein [uncultured Alistipes sp.]|jgi:transcriptional regulator, araC family|uniref:helix-turn-helix domain-containing protein n=1 Tax=uncultured Alistipes sp. TaxID=538949 RepID=UPI0025D9D4A3|nr:helix-turn-helix domain-containing protein [uncultured Alistipes sp.]